MNLIDIIILTPIGIGFVFGLFKGLIKELTSLAAIIIGIYGSKLFAPVFGNFLLKFFKLNNSLIIPLSYLIVFLLIVGILMLLAHIFDKVISSISLGGLNRVLGGFFGALKYALIISFLINIVDVLDQQFSFISEESKETSITYTPIMVFGPVIWDEVQKLDFFENNNKRTEKDAEQEPS